MRMINAFQAGLNVAVDGATILAFANHSTLVYGLFAAFVAYVTYVLGVLFFGA